MSKVYTSAVVIIPPEEKWNPIQEIRKKYDKNWKFMKPHITLVYPFSKVEDKKLKAHIRDSLSGINPFKLRLKGLRKSKKEHYLYLLCGGGKEKIMELYKRFHRSLLKEFKNKDMPSYVPHITLGKFDTEEEIREATSKEKAAYNQKQKTSIKAKNV